MTGVINLQATDMVRIIVVMTRSSKPPRPNFGVFFFFCVSCSSSKITDSTSRNTLAGLWRLYTNKHGGAGTGRRCTRRVRRRHGGGKAIVSAGVRSGPTMCGRRARLACGRRLTRTVARHNGRRTVCGGWRSGVLACVRAEASDDDEPAAGGAVDGRTAAPRTK